MSNEQPTTSVLDALPVRKLEAYFEPGRNRYWIEDNSRIWIPLTKEDARDEAAKLGHTKQRRKGSDTSPADEELRRVRMEQNIVYAGPVAGNPPGLHETGTTKYLVTQGPALPNPVKGDWSQVKELGVRLFGELQFKYILGWSKNALHGLYSGQCRRGQLLVLAGPPGCGKSFWQNRVITPMLGGRVARPIQYMTGQTSFNEDIIKAEHLLLEDENAKTDVRSRRELAASVKNFTVNVTQRVHPKGVSAFVVESSHWMSMSVNDEPENLGTLPILDESIMDKLILIKCLAALNEEWIPSNRMPEFQDRVTEQIGAFNHYLLNEHVVDEDLKDHRFGIKQYHDPELLARIDGLSPEYELEQLIDVAFGVQAKQDGKLSETQSGIQVQLESHPDTSHRARRLLTWSTACGQYLERLARKKPHKFVKPKHNDNPRKWVVRWESQVETT